MLCKQCCAPEWEVSKLPEWRDNVKKNVQPVEVSYYEMLEVEDLGFAVRSCLLEAGLTVN